MGNTNKPSTGFLGLGDFSDECNGIKKCNSLKRINTVLEVYQTVLDDEEFSIQKSIIQYIENNDYNELINDYHHILTKHLNYSNNNANKANFKFINTTLIQNIDCNITDCQTYHRNQRNKEKKGARQEKVNRNYDFKGLFIMNLLDNIHTYFIHGYKSGYRVKFDAKIYDYIDKDFDNIFSHDAEIVSLESALWMKREELIKLRGENIVYNNRYQTYCVPEDNNNEPIGVLKDSISLDDDIFIDILFHKLSVPGAFFKNVLEKSECVKLYLWLKHNSYDSDGLIDDIMCMEENQHASNVYTFLKDTKLAFISNQMVDIVKYYRNISDESEEQVRNINSYGQRFFYWEWLRNNSDNDITFNPGYKYKDWYIPQKYDSLKTEILHFLSVNEFNATKNKAIRLLYDSIYLKRMQSTKECDAIPLSVRQDRPYGITPGEPLSYFHLMSVLFHTDYPSLWFQFSSTFKRRLNETDESFKKRNSEFHCWSKLLHETVHLYGTNLYGTKYDYTTDQWISEEISPPILYHSVSFECLNSFISRFSAPTSLTRHIEVAVIYSANANKDGIVLEVQQYDHINCCPYYFNCSIVSRYGVEDERLFCGGSSVSNMCKNIFDNRLLQCRSIRSIEIKQNILWYFRALSVLNTIITRSNLCDSDNFIEKYIKCEGWYFKVVYGLLMEIQNESIKEYGNYPKFIVNCFKKFIENTKIINVCIHCLKRFYPSFIQLFKLSSNKKCSNLLLIDNICDIFTECTSVAFSPEIVSKEFVNRFIDILHKIDDNESKWKALKRIKLLNYRYARKLDVRVANLLNSHDEYWVWNVKEEKESWDEHTNEMRYTLTVYRK